jgi:hypothetical protein
MIALDDVQCSYVKSSETEQLSTPAFRYSINFGRGINNHSFRTSKMQFEVTGVNFAKDSKGKAIILLFSRAPGPVR